MARFPERHLNQTAVYWGSPTKNGQGGYTYDDPVEIDCRWLNRTKVIQGTMGQPGKEVISVAQVRVDQDVDLNGYLYLGELTDLDAGERSDPSTVSTSFIIKQFDKIPTIKGDLYFRKVYL